MMTLSNLINLIKNRPATTTNFIQKIVNILTSEDDSVEWQERARDAVARGGEGCSVTVATTSRTTTMTLNDAVARRWRGILGDKEDWTMALFGSLSLLLLR
ncbi:hypothetical protein AAHE18_09G075700 [Arachis hypogaea]